MAETFDKIEDVQIPCLLDRKIDNGRFHLIKRIGHGGYSVVYLAIDLQASASPDSPSPQHVAVKCVLDRHGRKAKIEREVDLHSQAAAAVSGVIQIYRTLKEGDLFFVILEYCPHGDLFSTLTETRIFLGNSRLIRSVFIQLIDIITALHRVGIYHRDLKPENILCRTPIDALLKKEAGTIRISLADFGLATQNPRSLSFGCGSYFYMTPECLAGTYSTTVKAYSSRAADIWALGIILVNLICGRSPWKAALMTDPSFKRFVKNPRWLRQMLPLSMPVYRFLNWIFSNHGNHIRMSELRSRFLKIDSFYMTEEEVAAADKTARLVAKDWMPETPLHDFQHEDFADITHVDDVTEHQLFDDTIPIHPDNGSSSNSSSSNTDSGSSTSNSAKISPISSVSGLTHGSAASSSESDFPITPETKPIHPTEGVPELPKGEQPVGDESWVLSASEVHSIHKTLSAQAVQSDTPEVERLVI